MGLWDTIKEDLGGAANKAGELLDDAVPDDSGGIPSLGLAFQGMAKLVDGATAVSNAASHAYSTAALLSSSDYLDQFHDGSGDAFANPFAHIGDAWDTSQDTSVGKATADAFGGSHLGHWSVDANDPAAAEKEFGKDHTFSEADLSNPNMSVHREWHSDTLIGNILSGSVDFASDWFLDPTVVAGKGSKAIRSAKYAGDLITPKALGVVTPFAHSPQKLLEQTVQDARDGFAHEASGGAVGRPTAVWDNVKALIGKSASQSENHPFVVNSTDKLFLPTVMETVPDNHSALLAFEASLPSAYGAKAIQELTDQHAALGDILATQRGLVTAGTDVARAGKAGETLDWAQSHLDNPLAHDFHKKIYDDMLKQHEWLGKAIEGVDEAAGSPARISNITTQVGVTGSRRVAAYQRAFGEVKSDIRWGQRNARPEGALTDLAGGRVFQASMKTIQATMYSRPIHVISWVAGQKPTNMVKTGGSNMVDAHKEVSALLNTFRVWDNLPDVKREWLDKFARTGTDRDRENVLMNMQEAMTKDLVADHGVNAGEAKTIFDDYSKAHAVMRSQMEKSGFMSEADGSFATVAQFAAQNPENFTIAMPFELMDKILGRHMRDISHPGIVKDLAIKKDMLVDGAGSAARAVNSVFRPLVILRPAFIPRNIGEAGMSAGAAHGTIPFLAHALEGVPNWMYNRRMGIIDHYASIRGKSWQKLSREQTQARSGVIGLRSGVEDEMREHLDDLDTIYSQHQTVLQGRRGSVDKAITRHQTMAEDAQMEGTQAFGERTAEHQGYIDQRQELTSQIAATRAERARIRIAKRKGGDPTTYLAGRNQALRAEIAAHPSNAKLGPAALAKKQAAAEAKLGSLAKRTGLPPIDSLVNHHDVLVSNLEQASTHIDGLNAEIADYGRKIALIGTARAARHSARIQLSTLSSDVQNEIARGNASSSDTVRNALTGAVSRTQQKMRTGSTMVEVQPGASNYWDALAYSLEHHFRYDKVGAKIIDGATPEDLTAWFRTHPGSEYLKSLNVKAADGPAKAQEMYDDLYRYTDNNPQVLAALKDSADPIHPLQLSGWMGGSKTLSPVHGPSLEANLATRRARLQEWAYEKVGAQPETRLARHPFYATMHQRFTDDQLNHYIYQGEKPTEAGLKAIDVAAHRYALAQLKSTMYTIDRYSNSASKLSNIMPFYAAWENTARRWIKFAYRDPSVITHGYQVYNSPVAAGISYDQHGNKIKSGTWNPMEPRYLKFTLPEFLHLPQEMRDIALNQGNLNVIAQGETPYAPGFGPLITIPASEWVKSHPDTQAGLAKLVGADTADQMMKSVLPFGPDPVFASFDQMGPAWARRGWQMLSGQNDPREGQQIAQVYMSQHQDWMNAGGRDSGKPEPSMQDAINSSHNISWLELASSFAAPTSVTVQTPYAFYSDLWKNLSAQYPREEAVAQYHKLVGDQYDEWMLGSQKNTSGLDPSVEAYQAVEANPGLAELAGKADPALIGMLFNPETYAFDKNVFVSQETHDIYPGSSTAFRSAKDPAAIEKTIHETEGWSEYTKAKATVVALATQRGEKDYTHDPQLSAVMKMFRANLGGNNPDWANAYDSYAGGGWKKTIRVLQTAMDNKEFMSSKQNDAKWGVVTQFMAARQKFVDAYNTTPDGTAHSALNTQWAAYGAALADSNPEFSQFYHRWLDSGTLERVE